MDTAGLHNIYEAVGNHSNGTLLHFFDFSLKFFKIKTASPKNSRSPFFNIRGLSGHCLNMVFTSGNTWWTTPNYLRLVQCVLFEHCNQQRGYLLDSFYYLGVVAFIVAFFFLVLDARKRSERNFVLDTWIQAARKERDSKTHMVLKLQLENRDANIEKLFTAENTRQLIASKKLSAAENIASLAKRCRKYGSDKNRVNAITEELYDKAFEMAKAIDDANNMASHKNETMPPFLYGVPISVKDHFSVKGTYATGGMACRLKQKDETDSLVVKLLQKAGAIPLCKGNTVQLMMVGETVNRIWGRTRNPWNLDRTPGGSSGGDAALVAMGCVPLSISSDGAGSIRIPACFCGVVGFKPTAARLSFKGTMKPRKNNQQGIGVALPAAIGCIATSVNDCALFMKAVCVPEHYRVDHNVPPLKFDDSAYYTAAKKLKIGYFKTDQWFEPCPTSKRALQESIDGLVTAGHACIPFQPPTDGWDNYGLFMAIMAAEGCMISYFEALEGEEMLQDYARMILLSSCPNLLRWVITKVVDARRAHLLRQTRCGGISVHNLWKLTAKLQEMRQKWSDAMQDAGIDAVIYPGFPIPAVRHETITKAGAGISYMLIANLLTWPSGVVPITTVRHDEQYYYRNSVKDLPRNQRDVMAKAVADQMTNSVGLPVGVSVLTPAFQDETCLRVMREIEEAVPFQERPTAFLEQTNPFDNKGQEAPLLHTNSFIIPDLLLSWSHYIAQGWQDSWSRFLPFGSWVYGPNITKKV